MKWKLVKAIIILPGTVLIFVPAALLAISKNQTFFDESAKPDQISFWLALLAVILGSILSIRTVMIFMKLGEGTPAPWNPPKKLVIRGPYCYVRNPMIIGVLLMLFAEALFFQSRLIALWIAIFFMGNAVYFPFFEEKSLEKRFGDQYREYKKHVPRWIPRLRPWSQNE